ncbi:DEAD/DEAH box helicase family protein [Nocardia nova]|uniref:DEAD/DEAH box helicase family protein n=1 Tax=Nocardia nova TaxID=37330 RepID=UPI0015E32FA2|nr:DEAD/DEAH box helicase family protein [Nocardia nova]
MRDLLARRMVEALMREPYLSASQIRERIGVEGASRSLVNSVLYARTDLFEMLGDEHPPIWAVREDVQEDFADPEDSTEPGEPDVVPDKTLSASQAAENEYAGPPLRAWQREAYDSWASSSRRGIVEAVTGSGKTAVGAYAAAAALAEGRQVVVLVPGIDLQRQWMEVLWPALPSRRIALFGGPGNDSIPENWDVLIATVQTASRKPIFARGSRRGALVIGDEVHRYGAGSFVKALTDDYDWRLGLTATLERADDGVERFLMPYFTTCITGCDYRRAKADGILAPARAALIGVDFTPREQARFDAADSRVGRARNILIDTYGAPEEPFGAYMAFVQNLARGTGEAALQAKRFLKYFTERRDILAECRAKIELLGSLPVPLLETTQSIIFTQQTATAGRVAHVLNENGLATEMLGASLKSAEREDIMQRFRDGSVRALAAPQLLDEGIDIPDAQIGIVLAASRTRRQMIQRMGRVIRPKSDGRTAVFVVMYVRGTSEDPAKGAHETFLSELQEIAEEQVHARADELAAILQAWLGGVESAASTTMPPIVVRPTPPQNRAPIAASPAATPQTIRPTPPQRQVSTASPASMPSTVDRPTPPEPHVTIAASTPEASPTPLPPTVVQPTPQQDQGAVATSTSTHSTSPTPSTIALAVTPERRPGTDFPTTASPSTDALHIDTRTGDASSQLRQLVDESGMSVTDRHRAYNMVVEWATESTDPIGEFLTVIKQLAPVRIPPARLLQLTADLRGVAPADLL